MNVGQVFLLTLGVVLGFATVILRSRTRGGGLIFLALYAMTVALLLAGFGLYRIGGIST